MKNETVYSKPIQFNIGGYILDHEIPIICPQDNEDTREHYFTKNGKDTSTKGNPQQFRCQDCNSSFYAHTSKFFLNLQDNLPETLIDVFEGGRISVHRLVSYFHIPYYTASRMMDRFLQHGFSKIWEYVPFHEKLRKSNAIFIDETFLKINGKTWYLIIAISGNNKLLGYCLNKDRKYPTIKKLLDKCKKNLEGGFHVLISDGNPTYIKYAREYPGKLVHVRHINKPPYGWCEIEMYHNDHGVRYRTVIRTRTDIFMRGGGFIGEVKILRYKILHKKFIKKFKFIDYSEEAKGLEVCLRNFNYVMKKKITRNKRWQNSFYSFFNVRLKEGRVIALDKNLAKVGAQLEILIPIFSGKHITTNLIEKENSVIKKFIHFGTHRELENWKKYIEVYFAFRDQPRLLASFASDFKIPKQMLTKISRELVKINL